MDAKEFIRTHKRMCKKYGDDCEGCILLDKGCYSTSTSIILPEDLDESVVDLVEKWSKDHPIKTRQSVFLEQYPDAIIGDDGFPYVAPCQLCDELIHGESIEDCENRGLCVECRLEFWMQEVE